jgi:hypothetical protein
MDYLDSVYSTDINDEKVVTYAQDMEAWGLWQEETRRDGVGDWGDTLENVVKRLDDLLIAFEEQSSWLQLTHPSQAINQLINDNYQFEHMSTIPFGEAKWMTHGAQSSGYSSWKIWQDGDSGLSAYRASFAGARAMLQEAANTIVQAQNTKFAEKIMEYIEFVYAANQFEFGCWGCNFYWWHRTQTVGIGAEAIKWSINPPETTETIKLDLDNDGILEFILRNKYAMYVFSQEGGRLIAWFDRTIEEILIYNDAPSSYLEDSTNNFQRFQRDKTGFWGRSSKIFSLRQKGLVDYPWENITNTFALATYASHTEDNSFRLSHSASGVILRKTMSLENEDSDLKVDYEITNERTSVMPFSIGMSYSPSNLDLLINGQSNLDYATNDGLELGVINTDANIVAGLTKITNLVSTSHKRDAMFAVGLQYNFEEVPALSTSAINFQLTSGFANKTSLIVSDLIPEIRILEPSEGETVEGILEFDVVVSSTIEIEKIELLFQSSVVFTRSDSGILQYYNPELPSGNYTFTIRAVTITGSVGEISITLNYIGKTVSSSSTDQESDKTSSAHFPQLAFIFGIIMIIQLISYTSRKH